MYQSFWKALKVAARKVGLNKRMFPYLLRHTRASELYEAPSAIRDAALGFQTPTMWKNYTHIRQAEAIRDYLWYETEGAPLITEDATETLKEVRDQLKVLSDKDEALAEALKDILGSMPAFKMVDRAGSTVSGTDRDPLVGVTRKLERFIEGLEGGE